MEPSIVASTVCGLAVGIALYAGVALLGWNGPHAESSWAPLLGPVAGAITAIVPGLVAGALSRRSGFLVGAMAGACASLVVSVLMATVYWPPFWEAQDITPSFLTESIAFAVSALITNGVAGLGGVHVARAKAPSSFSSSGRATSAE
jgi:hypothetical protein